ncbi:polyprenyl synthetase family protein [bacterium BMS3Abin03]|jgi:geranylgeranyl diphosphate synthase type II|nr:polyprenyl synthetase family protein [bacterium BMS3Abin03]MCG6961295.1 polyprenyl synthetase family protein [bacterium BMS3Abin03]
MNTGEIKKFSKLYERERKKIDVRLINSVKTRKPKSLYEPALYLVSSKGKRIRPLLVLLTTKAVGGKFKNSYNAAVAMELLHNFTLVHDDIMDNADKRRGRLTLHKKYDTNTAILVGDSLLSVAYEYILKDSNGNAKNIITSFTNGLVEVCEGQSLDTDFEKRYDVTIDEYLLMIKKKTASMIKICCEIGSTLGGGTKQEVKAITDYGLNLGIAFQIQDDLLDISAEESNLGKRIGGDLLEGKKTYLFIKALEKSTGEDRKSLQKVIINKGIRVNQINKFRKLYDELGVIEDAKTAINLYTGRALQSLYIIKKEEDRKILIWFADNLVKRKK